MAARWSAADIPDLAGRAFLVTGASSGLGLETARRLAEHGAHVIMAVRDQAKGESAAQSIRSALPTASLELRLLDLSDLDSVRTLVEELRAEKTPIDVLVNNAGVMMTPYARTRQGNELQFATNHLGHFALTGLLLPTLAEGRDPRVVTVSSTMHKSGKIHFDDLAGAASYSPVGAYAQSKFANVLFALELHRRLTAAGSPVRSTLAHPGYSDTNLGHSTKGLMRIGMKIGNPLLAQSVKIGALPQLYAATAPGAASGSFYGPSHFAESRGYPKEVHPVKRAQDPETAARLWTVSAELTGVDFPI